MGYKTTSSIAAGLLAGVPPLDIIARSHADMYNWKKQIQADQWMQEWDPHDREQRREEEIYRKWEDRISLNEWRSEDTTTSVRLREAFEEHIKHWVERCHGSVDFWTTQVLTGHGYFGEFIHKMGKCPNAICEHCTSGVIDSAKHTLEVCTAWDEQREAYKESTGLDNINLRNAIENILDRELPSVYKNV